MIITVYLSQSMSASDIGFPMYATRINVFDALVSFGSPNHEHANACHIHRHETLWRTKREILPDFRRENGTSFCRILIAKA